MAARSPASGTPASATSTSVACSRVRWFRSAAFSTSRGSRSPRADCRSRGATPPAAAAVTRARSMASEAPNTAATLSRQVRCSRRASVLTTSVVEGGGREELVREERKAEGLHSGKHLM